MSSDVDVELVRSLGTKFIERRDVKALMDEPHVEYGGKPIPWQPVHSPFTMQDFTDHLAGTRTFGHYLIAPEENTCKLFAFDIDLRENKPEKVNARGEVVSPAFTGSYWDEESTSYQPCDPRTDWPNPEHPARPWLTKNLSIVAAILSEVTADLGLQVAVSLSGNKGLHVYGFTGSVKATFAREAALGVLSEIDFKPERGDNFFAHPGFPNLMVELFPKQDSLDGKDLGNLMALPLGINRKTGKQKHFVTVRDYGISLVSPEEALSGYRPW